MTSLRTLTDFVDAPFALAYSTPVAVRLFAFEVSKRIRVTVAFGRTARLLRGGRGSR